MTDAVELTVYLWRLISQALAKRVFWQYISRYKATLDMHHHVTLNAQNVTLNAVKGLKGNSGDFSLRSE